MSGISVFRYRIWHHRSLRFGLCLALFAVAWSGCASSSTQTAPSCAADQNECKPVTDAPGDRLPNVLIIGDSISMGYTPVVQALLKDKANVQRPKTNCADTRKGLRELTSWLGDTKWDVIHFNWGLHDLCYRRYENPNGKGKSHRDKVHGKISVPVETYEKNLEKLVRQLKATGAVLVWANTTVVPEGEEGRCVGDDEKYNKAAAKVMKKHGIAIDDLYSLTKSFAPELFAGAGNVHYTKEGSQKLGSQVACAIEEALKAGVKR